MIAKRKKISILGCGWLGFPLAKKLQEIGYNVKGSTTSESKLEILKRNGILPFKIEVSENEIEGDIETFLADCAILIVNIPPKLRSDSSDNFEQKIENLIPFIEKSAVSKVLFVSSTSVYADAFPIIEIDENSIPNPDSESGKQLLKAEYLLLTNSNFKTIVLRFGGLIGEDRHPIKFLAGKTGLKNPDAPVNLIHQEDCIGIIEQIVSESRQDMWGKFFNAVSPQHPTRKEYYQKIALAQNLVIPEFDDSLSNGKIIKGAKLKLELNYNFKKSI